MCALQLLHQTSTLVIESADYCLRLHDILSISASEEKHPDANPYSSIPQDLRTNPVKWADAVTYMHVSLYASTQILIIEVSWQDRQLPDDRYLKYEVPRRL